MNNKDIENILQRHNGSAFSAASVTIEKNNELVFCSSIGDMKPGSESTITADSTFDIASITKLFTTAIILNLHQRKKLDITNKCANYLPNFAHSNVTVIDLLTHNADFGVSLKDIRTEHGERTSSALKQIIPPKAPGNEFQYSNPGFISLGFIIEKVTDRDLAESFDEMCESLQLANTSNFKSNKHPQTPPTEYRDGAIIQSSVHDETAELLGGIAGHAGMISSSRDLAQFGKSWLNGDIVKDVGLLDTVFRNYNPAGIRGQGLGWWNGYSRLNYNNPNFFCHPGFTGCFLGIEKNTNTVVSVMTNRTFLGRDNQTYLDLIAATLPNYSDTPKLDYKKSLSPQ